jgi:LemA protein
VIALSRQAYNLTVQAYNNAVQTFPTNIVASFSGFSDRPYLSAEESDRDLPEIQMDLPAAPPAANVAH